MSWWELNPSNWLSSSSIVLCTWNAHNKMQCSLQNTAPNIHSFKDFCIPHYRQLASKYFCINNLSSILLQVYHKSTITSLSPAFSLSNLCRKDIKKQNDSCITFRMTIVIERWNVNSIFMVGWLARPALKGVCCNILNHFSDKMYKFLRFNWSKHIIHFNGRETPKEKSYTKHKQWWFID